ncbi:MAG: hypothetical protein QMD46_08675 [Methanomicrobiales archaeon]|nr:hypothetical protein [Methanomicrobiales archaeon]
MVDLEAERITRVRTHEERLHQGIPLGARLSCRKPLHRCIGRIGADCGEASVSTRVLPELPAALPAADGELAAQRRLDGARARSALFRAGISSLPRNETTQWICWSTYARAIACIWSWGDAGNTL